MTDSTTSESRGTLTRIEYNDTIVRLFILATIFWGLVGMAAGVLIASQLSFHWMNFDTSWLTFGRLRPLHTNAAIFAFVGNMMFAGIYHSTQRLVKARLASNFLSHLHFWGWQAIIVAAAITLPLGFSRSKEYAELIWPINIAVVIIWIVFAVNFFWTLARRNERTLYVAIWFYIATIVTVAMLYIVNHLSIPTGLLHSYPIFGGVQDALVQWWYGHNAVAFFLTTPILGIMYYYMPKAAERPVYSYRLSVVHFWSLVFVYIWAGPHHLLNTALPEWLQSLGMIFSLMLWAPSWGGMLNGLLTLRGAWHKLRDDPVLKFLAAGVTFYGMSTFEGPLLAIKSVNALAHYTDWIVGHVHSGTLGWNGFMTAGVFYWLVPRLWGTKLHSQSMANLHFWLGMVGILLYISSMWVSGIMQGLMLNKLNPDGTLAYFNYLDALNAARIMMHTRLFGGLLYLIGFGLLGWNLFKTMRAGSPVKETVEVYQQKSDREKDLGIIGTFWNAPVLYCLAVIVVACTWAFGNRIVSFLSFFALLLITFGFLYDLKRFSKKWGDWYERLLASAMPFTILTLLAVIIGGAIQIIPTALTTDRTTSIDGVSQHLYTPLELAGRDLYVREGCYNCHTQMIRPFVSEVVRYGRDRGYSKLGESMYDYPSQWGSKRTGPDLHRVGGKYGNDWHFRHMWNPRDTSLGSNMPNYTWLFTSVLDTSALPSKISVLQRLGVPFPDISPEEIEASVREQAQKIAADLASKELKANPDREIIALIAYLQQLGIPADASTTAPTSETAQAAQP